MGDTAGLARDREPALSQPLPTAAQIDALLAFREALERPGRSFCRAAETGPWPIYEPDVAAFFGAAGQPCWSDYDYVPAEQWALLGQPQAIAAADLEGLRSMLTCCVRAERFGDGAWCSLLERGVIQALLARLADLRSTLPS